jgi:uncharacterized protein CbrC (UPF0167 family)
VEPCYVCREIAERSDTYERWLFAENFGDGATLHAAAVARGYCTLHARRIVDRDHNVAGPIAAFVLRAVAAELRRQLGDRRGYRDALDARALCPWCRVELEALEYALTGRAAKGPRCQPHAQAASQLRANHLRPRNPLSPGTPLSRPSQGESEETATWWSAVIDDLAESLDGGTCPPCRAAGDASDRREAFYRAGSRPSEHWETPRLCPLHDAALGQPRTPDFIREPDSIDRLCDWCRAMERAARRYAELFSSAYQERAFRLHYACTPGLCLPHAAIALHSPQTARDTRDAFAAACRTRVTTAIWELDERAVRQSWSFSDQGQLRASSTVAHRAWWLIAGGTYRLSAE